MKHFGYGEKVHGTKTGARGLRAIMESTLMDLMYKTPSDDTIRKCIITKEAVEGTGEPQIVHGEAPAQPVNPANTGRRSQRTHKRVLRKQPDEGI